MSKKLRICLSGLMGAGKDYVAQNLSCEVLGFADPMYEICRAFTGTADKKLPGIRKMLQQIGVWGRCIVSDEYPWTVERAMFTAQVKMLDRSLIKYGDGDPDYWVKKLLDRVDIADAQGYTRIAVTNVRFANEAEALKKAGFDHYLVRCHEKTRETRLGGAINNDLTEQYALELKDTMPPDRIIWNDAIVSDPAPNALTLEHVIETYADVPANPGAIVRP